MATELIRLHRKVLFSNRGRLTNPDHRALREESRCGF
jgi:hypothetical protein